ncbi:MAG TPA: hypothetical protein VGJ92_05185 [Methanocella sp.]|jgi:hypothetical protein
MSDVAGIIRGVAVAIAFALMLYAGYYMQGQIDLPSFVTDLLPPGTVVGGNDQVIAFPDVAHSAGMWQGSQVLAGEMDAAQWVKDHTQGTDKFVADIGGAEAIMGMTTRVSLVGGDWANSPDPVHNMEITGRIYSTTNATDAHDMALDSGCAYVWLPNRRLNTGTFDNDASKDKFEDAQYFQMVYKNDDITIYRVLP